MESDDERRRRTALLMIMVKYLRYVDEHKTDEVDSSTEGIGVVHQIRQAALDANLIVRTDNGLDLTEQGRTNLEVAKATGFGNT